MVGIFRAIEPEMRAIEVLANGAHDALHVRSQKGRWRTTPAFDALTQAREGQKHNAQTN